MYVLNNSRQWTEDAKGELNVPKQNSILRHISKIKHCTIKDYYLIKIDCINTSIITICSFQKSILKTHRYFS